VGVSAFRVLGPVEAWSDETRLALGGPQQVKLLAFLLLNANRAVSADGVIDAVWGAERQGAAKRLQMGVLRLRRGLEPLNNPDRLRLRTVSGGYLLSVAPGELDSEVFGDRVREGRSALDDSDPVRAIDSLTEALGLWRGPPLAEVAFDDFAQAEVRRLEELRLVALETRIDANLQLGRHVEVIAELEGLMAERPNREHLAGQLMLALYRAGRQGDALETYQHTRAHLASELGLEPGPALKALQTGILEQSAELKAPTPGDARPAAAANLHVGVADRDRYRDSPTANGVGDDLPALPAGTVTFIFTDIEDATDLLRNLGGEVFGQELRRHRDRIRETAVAHHGRAFGVEGDAVFIVFSRASDAVAAAQDLQAAFAEEPVRRRVGIHTGEPLVVDNEYVGLDVRKAARICAAAHGGQVLVSQATRELAGDGLRDLGEYRLKDLTAPERLFQLGGGDFPPLRTLRPTNLPVQPGPLLGRRDELAELLTLARANRLVTLTGPGGSGKTRLALQLAVRLSDDYRDGAWWVPLAAITDPSLVAPTIAQSLGARGELREHLAGKRVLLLLDNLEQVLDCAPLIADLLAGLPDLSVIATSRERLAITFEQEYSVPPLDEATAEELFVSRARQLVPAFEPDEMVGEICRRLDRLPLALELASTRVKLMTTAQMLARIERRLDLLSKGRRDAPDRQATMRATIGWSYDLLPQPEQALFRRLGVFAGSFELEAAEAVCDADLDGLQSLIEKSLLRRDGQNRFFLLELTREYALERLHAAREEAELSRRHADWAMQLAKRADEHLESAEQGRWLMRLEADTDNLRAALAWCSERDPEGAIALVSTVFGLWMMHGQLQELIPRLERALRTSATLDTHTRAAGLRTLGSALSFTEQYDKAREPLEESLALFRQLGDQSGEASALTMLGMGFSNQGSFPRGIDLLQAALAISRENGDKRSVARVLNIIAGCYIDAGDLERAKPAIEEAVAIHKELGHKGAAASDLGTLADVALAQGDHQQAERHAREALEMVTGVGDERNDLYSVAQLACAAALRRDVYAAGRLWAVAEATEKRLGMRMLTSERARYERIVAPLENDQIFQAGYHDGRDVDLARAVRELARTERNTLKI
jgi:predicted ATPase/class 3 adenylate cyclase/DNA-binding winged helix-turn-helix (wHTH) protein